MNGSMSLLEVALEWSEVALSLALRAGFWALPVAAVVLLINVLFRRWLSPRQMCLLWGLVLLRLLIPVSASSSFSMQNLLASASFALTESTDLMDHFNADSHDIADLQPAYPAAPPVAPPTDTDTEVWDDVSSAVDQASVPDLFDWFFTLLPLVWLIGGATSLIGTMVIHWRFCRKLKQTAACDDPRLRRLWDECCQQANVHGSIPMLVFEGVQQPAVLGLFWPKLLLPTDAAVLSDQQLRMVMLHELAHVRYFDIAANWVLVVIRAIHWWNPIYWLAAARYQGLREQACDTFAIQRMEGQPSQAYGDLLLTLAQRKSCGPWRVMLPASILGFYSSFFHKRAMRNRLKALRSISAVRGRWHTTVALGLIGLMAICALTDASTQEAAPDNLSDWLPRAGRDWHAASESAAAPDVTRSYDVGKVLDRIAADGRSDEEARSDLNDLLVQLLQAEAGNFPATTTESVQSRVELHGAKLTVDAPLNLHAQIARNLSVWEQHGLGQITIEARFITHEQDLVSAMGISWNYLDALSDDREERFPAEIKSGMPTVRAAVDNYLPVAMATLNDQQALALEQTAQNSRRANILQAPKVTIFNGQVASVFDLSQRPFAVGLQDNGAGMQQPIIKIVEEGAKLMLRAVRSDDAKTVQLDARAEFSHIDEVRTALMQAGDEPTAIQIPRVKRFRIDASSELPDGGSLLIGCIPTYERKEFLYVLLTVRNYRPQAEEAP